MSKVVPGATVGTVVFSYRSPLATLHCEEVRLGQSHSYHVLGKVFLLGRNRVQSPDTSGAILGKCHLCDEISQSPFLAVETIMDKQYDKLAKFMIEKF